MFGEDSPLSVEEADALWRGTSGKYAEGAPGPVRAHLHDPDPKGVFYDVDLPLLRERLQAGQVTSIEIIDLVKGTREVIAP